MEILNLKNEKPPLEDRIPLKFYRYATVGTVNLGISVDDSFSYVLLCSVNKDDLK